MKKSSIRAMLNSGSSTLWICRGNSRLPKLRTWCWRISTTAKMHQLSWLNLALQPRRRSTMVVYHLKPTHHRNIKASKYLRVRWPWSPNKINYILVWIIRVKLHPGWGNRKWKASTLQHRSRRNNLTTSLRIWLKVASRADMGTPRPYKCPSQIFQR